MANCCGIRSPAHADDACGVAEGQGEKLVNWFGRTYDGRPVADGI